MSSGYFKEHGKTGMKGTLRSERKAVGKGLRGRQGAKCRPEREARICN